MERKDAVKRKLTETFSLPPEVVMNLPLVQLTGNTELMVENYKNVTEFKDGMLKLNTTCGTLKIEGRNLRISRITSESMRVSGHIAKIEYC